MSQSTEVNIDIEPIEEVIEEVKVEASEEAIEEASEEVVKPVVKPAKKSKIRHSSWLITINTNRPINTGLERELPILKERLTNAYNKLGSNILDLIEYKQGSEDDVDDIHMVGNVEIGSERRLLHMHAVLSIKHRAKIRMKYDEVRKLVQSECPSCYMNMKSFNNSYQYMLDYINKNKQLLLRDM